MKYTKVYIDDWNGVVGLYDILELTHWDDATYSCVFRNSEGDIEKKFINEENLFQSSKLTF